MRRGARCSDEARDDDSVDFLGIDWFELAPLPVEEVRRRLNVEPKSEAAIRAGSVGPWEPGGISLYQLAAGEAMAQRQGRSYDSHGATARAAP